MPHSSATGTPMAWKNSSTEYGVGAAATPVHSSWSRPSFARTPANSCSCSVETLGSRFAGLLGAHSCKACLHGGS